LHGRLGHLIPLIEAKNTMSRKFRAQVKRPR
jgi:hypothetical protein